ncbi:carbohydrate esterase family 4 protein [Amylocarpus encephaloides]|uniref:chitin deacetylase n=1 Tax=Amylocarpus encephaloides TaxID=45428 RepID=A0A9P8BYP2_9HELO|nr:carbohydrate esterase family 4 protein [Amylocarpus encephaloides]
MRLAPLVRRVRRQFLHLHITVTSSLPPGPPTKHIKIDDEERSLSPNRSQSHTRRSPRRRALKMLALILLLLTTALLAYTIYKPPSILIKQLQSLHPDVIFHLPLSTGQKIVALTIDDAPSVHTRDLLATLAKHNATATFFVIGSQLASLPKGGDIIHEIHRGDHELGNHAWEDRPSISLRLPTLSSQITRLDALLPENNSGLRFFRPGSGFFNGGMVDLVKSLGYRMALGSVYPHDPQIHSARVNARHVVGGVRSGSVVIMHDRRHYSNEQLGLILEGLGNKGYQVVSLGELVRLKEREEGSKSS